MVSTTEDSPARQLLAAWHAATAVAAEWAERTAAVTAEAFHKLTSDPAVRAVGRRRPVLAGGAGSRLEARPVKAG